MRRHGQTSREPALFDLPLVVDPGLADEVDRQVKNETRREATATTAEAEQIELPAGTPAVSEGLEEERPAALIRYRFQAGILDSAATAAALGVLLAGAAKLGAPAVVADWPAYLLVVSEFAFFWIVFSVSFWGRTPGMARARLAAVTSDGEPMTPGRATLRWLGGVITLLFLGLPALLALRDGRSLADALSGSRLTRT